MILQFITWQGLAPSIYSHLVEGPGILSAQVAYLNQEDAQMLQQERCQGELAGSLGMLTKEVERL